LMYARLCGSTPAEPIGVFHHDAARKASLVAGGADAWAGSTELADNINAADTAPSEAIACAVGPRRRRTGGTGGRDMRATVRGEMTLS
jgi:hypothetical protein